MRCYRKTLDDHNRDKAIQKIFNIAKLIATGWVTIYFVILLTVLSKAN